MQPIASVIDPAKSLALADLDAVKDELGVSADDVSQNTRLTRYVLQASAQAHSYCHRIFPVQTYRNTFQPRHVASRYGPLCLSARPITKILGITDYAGALDAADYEVDADAGLVHRVISGVRCNWLPACEITVDFNAGFVEIPADVVGAVIRLVRWQQGTRGWDANRPRDPFLRAREADTYGRMEFFGSFTPGMVGGLPQEVAQMLDPYVLPVFA